MPDLAMLGIKVDSRDVKAADKDLDHLSQTAGKAEASTKRLGSQVDQNTGFFAKNRGAIQNTSYQLTDFVTQVQMGTRASVALGQQLPQMLAGFGAMGAAIGLVVSLTPTLVDAFLSSSNASKKLEESVDDLYKVLGSVGETAAEFSMDNLYKEYNKANAATRAAIIEQLKFQQVMIETQRLMAQQSLSKQLGGIGQITTMDRLAGAFGSSQAEKLSGELGVSLDVAKDLLPAINGLRNGTEDASNFMARFGRSLAESNSGAAQQLVKDVKALADGGRDAAAAQTKLSEALQKIGLAGGGNVALGGKKSGRGSERYSKTELSAAQQEIIDAVKQGQRIFEETRTPLEALNAEYDKLNRLLELGTINQDTYNRAVSQAQLEYDKATKAVGAWDDSLVKVDKKASEIDMVISDAFSNAADAIANFGQEGQKSFGQMIESMIRDLIRLELRMSMMSMYKGAGGLSGIIGSLFGGGNVDTSFTTGLGSANYGMDYTAASFDGGGFTGVGMRSGGIDGKGGFPAILHPNETVIDHSKGQSSGTVVNIHNAPPGTRTKSRQQGWQEFIDIFLADVANGGEMSRAMQGAYNLGRTGR